MAEREQIRPDITLVNLSPMWAECWLCGVEVMMSSGGQGVPVYEDLLLHNDYQGAWGGSTACKRCFDFQGRLTAPMPRHEARRALGLDAA